VNKSKHRKLTVSLAPERQNGVLLSGAAEREQTRLSLPQPPHSHRIKSEPVASDCRLNSPARRCRAKQPARSHATPRSPPSSESLLTHQPFLSQRASRHARAGGGVVVPICCVGLTRTLAPPLSRARFLAGLAPAPLFREKCPSFDPISVNPSPALTYPSCTPKMAAVRVGRAPEARLSFRVLRRFLFQRPQKSWLVCS
jgi:hypothetical protein